MSDKVERFYDHDPQREWNRLDANPLEFELTLRYLRRLLAPASHVLDLGGGPGRYAFALSEDGHRVTLADLSAANLDFARRKAAELGRDLQGYVKADARDLSMFDDAGFDAVLALGPLYHLLDPGDRHRAVRECLRVLKPGGLLALAFISIYAPVYDMAVPSPADIGAMRQRLLQFIQEGTYIASEGSTFTDAWFVDPFAVEDFLTPFPLERLHVIGAEGMLAQSKHVLYQQPPEVLREWIEFAYETAETEAARAGSEHVVYFGRKRAG